MPCKACVPAHFCGNHFESTPCSHAGSSAAQPWGPYIKLSYSACAMRAIESWSLSICGVAAGWLPNPSAALSAMAGERPLGRESSEHRQCYLRPL